MAEPFTEDLTAVCVMGHMGGLAAELVLMLAQAAGLPDPQSVTLYGIINGNVHDHVTLQFPRHADSRRALALWAATFGGVIESATHDGDNGPELWVTTSFPWLDLEARAFAHIPLPQPEATATPDEAWL